MTQQAETILTRKITGLTWGVILAIVGTFGTGGFFIVESYVKIQKSIDRSAIQYESLKEQQQDIKNDLRNINNRVDMVESKLITQRIDK